MATANLILGDCIEKMKELPANSIDAVITRLSCISSAVNLHAQDSATPIETVIIDAKKLEAYANGKS
jgi:predicted methyltransferase